MSFILLLAADPIPMGFANEGKNEISGNLLCGSDVTGNCSHLSLLQDRSACRCRNRKVRTPPDCMGLGWYYSVCAYYSMSLVLQRGGCGFAVILNCWRVVIGLGDLWGVEYLWWCMEYCSFLHKKQRLVSIDQWCWCAHILMFDICARKCWANKMFFDLPLFLFHTEWQMRTNLIFMRASASFLSFDM